MRFSRLAKAPHSFVACQSFSKTGQPFSGYPFSPHSSHPLPLLLHCSAPIYFSLFYSLCKFIQSQRSREFLWPLWPLMTSVTSSPTLNKGVIEYVCEVGLSLNNNDWYSSLFVLIQTGVSELRSSSSCQDVTKKRLAAEQRRHCEQFAGKRQQNHLHGRHWSHIMASTR